MKTPKHTIINKKRPLYPRTAVILAQFFNKIHDFQSQVLQRRLPDGKTLLLPYYHFLPTLPVQLRYNVYNFR